MENFLFSAGGGDEIGASCYYICLKGRNFLLDCGIRYMYKRQYPSLNELTNLMTMDTLNDLDGVFISHGHYDHNGALPLLASKLKNEKIEFMCSDLTGKLTEIQLNILKKHQEIKSYAIYEDINIERAIEKIKGYPVNERIDKMDYSFYFIKGGHIPGATMVYLEVEGKKILYTGDFSDIDYPLTPRYLIPRNIDLKNIDLLLINGTRAFNNEAIENKRRLKREINRIFGGIFFEGRILLEVTQINNGMEIAVLLNNHLDEKTWDKGDVKIYIDEAMYQMFQVVCGEEKFERIMPLSKLDMNSKEKHIIITMKGNRFKFYNYTMKYFSYSLHGSYRGLMDLILKIKAKKTFVVHVDQNQERKGDLVKELQEKGYDGATYIENEKIYEF